jgi:8-oxo-dGTP pyrophosphatase MutT (NUDIX family)
VADTEPMPNAFVPPEQYYPQLARVRQGAGALITSPDGRVVMYDVTYRDYLELPGGAVEPGESPPGTGRPRIRKRRRSCQWADPLKLERTLVVAG